MKVIEKSKVFIGYKSLLTWSSNLKSKKGIILTVTILVVITLASFLIWLVPMNNDLTFVISDNESHIDGVKVIHETISENLEKEFQRVLNNDLDPEEYIEMAEVSSSQINSQIIQLVQSKASEEWHESYLNYIESLKQFNSYIRESIVAANKIHDSGDGDEIKDNILKMVEFKRNSQLAVEASDRARP